MLLSGPEETLKYIRELEPDDILMTNVFAEGGILYNADERRVLFWGGDNVPYHPYLRRPFLKLLPALWQGWSINWAMHGVADLAHALGWDVWEVLKDISDDTDFLAGTGPVVERVLILFLSNLFSQAFLTIVSAQVLLILKTMKSVTCIFSHQRIQERSVRTHPTHHPKPGNKISTNRSGKRRLGYFLDTLRNCP